MKKEDFILRALEKHGDKYDYSLLPDEFNSKDKVSIICHNHSVFLMNADNHLSRGSHCPLCAKINKSIKNRQPLEYFQKLITEKFPELQIDYTGYVDSMSIVKSICPHHGESFRRVKDILRSNYQCNECSKTGRGLNRRKSEEEFITKAKDVHGDTYDYSLVEFESFGNPVIILCAKHGEFNQTPTVHIKGFGCKRCADEYVGSLKRKPVEDLPDWLFKDKYSKPLLDTYVKSSGKITFVCERHGEFKRKPTKLKGEFICPSCNKEFGGNKSNITTELFLKQITKIRPEYDFSKVEYVNSVTHVEVTCDKGHTFTARPANLKIGHGCPVCYEDRKGDTLRKGKEFYIAKSIECHGNKYDYSLTEFNSCKDKTIVVCHDHGQFTCTMDNHSRGKGCPRCSSSTSGYKAIKAGTFYILKVTDSVGKFGISNQFSKRLQQIVKQSCFDIETLHTFNFEDGYIPRLIESTVIASDIQKGVVNRCDMKSGYSETFYLKDLSKILEIVDNFTNDLSG